MQKCNEDWRTCGHCKAVSGDYGMYPLCDKVGFFETLVGGDICPNAPDSDNVKDKEAGTHMQKCSSDTLMKMLSELFEIKLKYEKIVGVLKKHVDDPDNLVELEELCIKARSDDTLDMLMDEANVDTLDDLQEVIKVGASLKGEEVLLTCEREDHGDEIVTSPDWWRCECRTNNIHPAEEKRCPKCKLASDECPDADIEDIRDHVVGKVWGKIKRRKRQ